MYVKDVSNSPMAGVRQFDEDEALERVLAVFWRKGYGATSMQDLAEATGVLRGSLYNAYGGKEAMFLAVFDRYKARYLADAAKALDKPDIETALTDFFAFSIRSMTTGKPSRGCLTTKTATDESADSAEIHAALGSLLDGLEELLQQRFARDDAHGRLQLPPAQAARLVVTMTRGIVVMERIHGDAAKLRATASALVKVLLHAP
ncbi:TetR/AcrR family transcriptional regulator [Variovorax sp. YR216]|uniref:TetR/AcrR family transcriptional regulator n=1 Tax=Variovorax sp. YR216 TaxID=1882828 RepID=UPI003525C0B7